MKTAVRKGGRFFMIRGRCGVFIELRIFPVLNSKDVTGEVAFNDAGFPGDDDLKDGQVNDEKRSRCMTVHIAAGR